MVSSEELPTFYEAVASLPNAVARDYLLLLLFTGLRRREAAALTWEDVDLKAKVIRTPATSTKAGRKLDLPMSTFVHDRSVAPPTASRGTSRSWNFRLGRSQREPASKSRFTT